MPVSSVVVSRTIVFSGCFMSPIAWVNLNACALAAPWDIEVMPSPLNIAAQSALICENSSLAAAMPAASASPDGVVPAAAQLVVETAARQTVPVSFEYVGRLEASREVE